MEICIIGYFNIMINDIFDNLGYGVGCALYADDGAIWKRGRNTKQVISGIQMAIKKVEDWSIEWSFKMSTSKSCFMIFSRKKDFKEIELVLYGKPLEQVKTFKYLGMWLDGRYTWKKHIEEIDKKCRRILNVMRAIAGKEWGAERDSMLTIYQALIRSTIDYGSIIYGSASETLLKSIDRIQYRALRICLGAIKTTPVNALLVEANEMPLKLRREKLSLVFWTSLKSYTGENIAKDILNNCWEYCNTERVLGIL